MSSEQKERCCYSYRKGGNEVVVRTPGLMVIARFTRDGTCQRTSLHTLLIGLAKALRRY